MHNILFNSEADFIKFFNNEKNNTAGNRKAILKTSRLCYWYCRYILDLKDVRTGINTSEYAYLYCKYVSDRAEVSCNITEADWALELNSWRAWKRGPTVRWISDYYESHI